MAQSKWLCYVKLKVLEEVTIKIYSAFVSPSSLTVGLVQLMKWKNKRKAQQSFPISSFEESA